MKITTKPPPKSRTHQAPSNHDVTRAKNAEDQGVDALVDDAGCVISAEQVANKVRARLSKREGAATPRVNLKAFLDDQESKK